MVYHYILENMFNWFYINDVEDNSSEGFEQFEYNYRYYRAVDNSSNQD